MKQLTKVLFAFIILLSLSSCGVSTGTPSKAYIPTSYSVYKGGYWGEWHSLVYRYIGDHVLDVYIRHSEREEERKRLQSIERGIILQIIFIRL